MPDRPRVPSSNYVVDLQRGQLVEDSIVKELRHPFALLDRVIYFAGQRPGALHVQPGPDRELWRATITPRPSATISSSGDRSSTRPAPPGQDRN